MSHELIASRWWASGPSLMKTQLTLSLVLRSRLSVRLVPFRIADYGSLSVWYRPVVFRTGYLIRQLVRCCRARLPRRNRGGRVVG